MASHMKQTADTVTIYTCWYDYTWRSLLREGRKQANGGRVRVIYRLNGRIWKCGYGLA